MPVEKQRVTATVVFSPHTTTIDADATISAIRRNKANVFVAPTPNIASAFNRLKRGKPHALRGRFTEHDRHLLSELLRIFKERDGKFAVVYLKDPIYSLPEGDRKVSWPKDSGEPVLAPKANFRAQLERERGDNAKRQLLVHLASVELDNVFNHMLLVVGRVDRQLLMKKILLEAEATKMRGEFLRRALLDLPHTIIEQSPALKNVPQISAVVQMSGLYSPIAFNAQRLIHPEEGWFQRAKTVLQNLRTPKTYVLKLNWPKGRKSLLRTREKWRLIDSIFERQRHASRGAMPPQLPETLMVSDGQLDRIVFEEFAERALRQFLPNSNKRFGLVTTLSQKLSPQQLTDFQETFLPLPRRRYTNHAILAHFLHTTASNNPFGALAIADAEKVSKLLKGNKQLLG